MLTAETTGDLEILLHAILNGGAEFSKLLKDHCGDYVPTDNQEPNIINEVERLYVKVKNYNEDNGFS